MQSQEKKLMEFVFQVPRMLTLDNGAGIFVFWEVPAYSKKGHSEHIERAALCLLGSFAGVFMMKVIHFSELAGIWEHEENICHVFPIPHPFYLFAAISTLLPDHERSFGIDEVSEPLWLFNLMLVLGIEGDFLRMPSMDQLLGLQG